MTPKAITIHCSDSGPKTTFDDIKAWHVIGNGWKDIGYHYVITWDGSLHIGRLNNKRGAHVKNANRFKSGVNIGICLVGVDQFNECQFDRLRELIDYLQRTFKIGHDLIFTHCEFESARAQEKTCPNMRATNLLLWLVTGSKSYIREYMIR